MNKIFYYIIIIIFIFSTPSYAKKDKVKKNKNSYTHLHKKTFPSQIGKSGVQSVMGLTILSFEDPTFPPTGWTIQNNDNDVTWSRTTTASGFGNGTASIKMDFFNYANVGAQDTFHSSILTGLVAGDSLKFDVAYAKYTGSSDGLKIILSTDGGITFTQIYSKSGNTLKTFTSDNEFTPTSAQWRTDRVGLPATVQGANVVIAFIATNDYGNNLYVDNIKIGSTPAIDLVVSSVDIYPPPYVAGQPNQVIVNVKWEGTAVPPTSISMTYKLGSLPTNELDGTNEVLFPIWAGSPLSSQMVFNTPFSPQSGENKMYVTGFIANDGVISNNSTFTTIYATSIVNTYPYFENFENGTNGWISGSIASPNDWILGTPTKQQIDRAYSGTNCWVTQLDTIPHSDMVNCYVTSPIFDFSSMTYDPIINFYHNYLTESGYDGGAIEVSINGSPFAVLGSFEDMNGYNWYDNESPIPDIGYPNEISGSNWSGTSEYFDIVDSGWVNSRLPLLGFAGTSGVQFRFRFVSDESNAYEGWAFDDFKIYESGFISGNVFDDINGNGIKDIEDLGMENAEVNLFGPEEKITYTDTDGNYIFDYLQSGTYQVFATVPNEFISTFPEFPPYLVTVLTGENPNYNFGLFQLGTISGNLFWDINGNQLHDINEANFYNWKVKLKLDGNILDSAFSDINGTYTFANLVPGNYQVSIDVQVGFSQTLPSPPGFYEITMTSGLNSINNFGAGQFGSVAGKLFNDLRANGILDVEDNFLSGWKVMVQSATSFDSTFTDANGNYSFVGLVPDTYTIIAENQDGYFPTAPSTETYSVTVTGGDNLSNLNFGRFKFGKLSGTVFEDINGNGTKDIEDLGISGKVVSLSNGFQYTTDVNGNYVFSDLVYGFYEITCQLPTNWTQTLPSSFYTVEILSGSVLQNNNFGQFKNISISGTVFEDINANGIKETGEPSLSIWQVSYSNSLTNGSSFTDESGFYSFANLGPGNYTVSQTLKNLYHQSLPNENYVLYPSSGNNIIDMNFGNYRFGNISGKKYLDDNLNGTYDVGETGIVQWTILLNNVPTTTDANGDYFFKDLVPKNYTLSEDIQATWTRTEPIDGNYIISLLSNQNVVNKNFGSYQKGSISGTVYLDDLADGINDSTDISVADLKIFISSSFGIDSTVTDENGNYKFENLIPTVYTVTIDIADSYNISEPSNSSYIEAIVSGLHIEGNDFGIYQNGSIYGIVYKDFNRNGILDAGDEGLSNWEVILSDASNSVSVFTNELGEYAFENVIPGDYSVDETLQEGWNRISPEFAYDFILHSGENISGIYFGNFSDTTSYRTFTVSTDLSLKPVKIKVKLKPGQRQPLPNVCNGRDTVISKVPGKGGMVLGIAITDKDLAKLYGWIRYKKGTDFGKFYTSSHDIATAQVFDSIRIPGKKTKRFIKELKPAFKSYQNPLAERFGVFKLNLISSQYGVTPSGFGDLLYIGDNEMWSGQTLNEISNNVDSILTFYNDHPIEQTDLDDLVVLFDDINNAFYVDIDTPNVSVTPYLIYHGVTQIMDVPFLTRTNSKHIDLNLQTTNVVEESGFKLNQNYPNPFNPKTNISFELPKDAVVTISIYNLLGQKLFDVEKNVEMESGENFVSFDATMLSSGIYFYSIDANSEFGKYRSIKKMVLMK